ncbi:MAG: anaerobic ribonucleoside-triphosphate reductase [Candidatus Bathyarchaeia archaeon]|jgi:ribonucleoside-triphosphate reductase
MPKRRPKSGLKVLKAASSSLRMQLLLTLVDKGPQSYTDLMKVLKLNPSRDAGRFAYHLKYLLNADLIEPDVDNKEYRLTELGKTIISFTEDIQQQFFQRKKILVRTSRLAMEEFDRNKIVEALVKEANVPVFQAQKIARETEKRLQEFKTKYLTAPLIREVVNAILLEKGLEEYRHKLTRLGLPVFDVNQLIAVTGTKLKGVEVIHKAAADAVMEEYTLLNVLPRDVADAHLSGGLHLKNLGTWVLKPDQFMHDLRFFLQRGLRRGGLNLQEPSYLPPKSLDAALITASNVLKLAATETSGEQTLDFFNIFLAPFTRGLTDEQIRDGLRLFIFNLNQSLLNGNTVSSSLGLEFVVPDFLKEKEAIGPQGKIVGYYGDYVTETQRLASILLDVMLEDDAHKPVFNPRLIIKIRPEVLQAPECVSLLVKSHEFAAQTGLPYFANLCPPEQAQASYTSTGFRLASNWREDWELDTLQTGSIDSVIVNLPRIMYEAEGKESSFFHLLDEQLEMALRALEIKYNTIKQREKENLLPFLMQKTESDQYFRIENSVRLVSFVGLNETIQSKFDKPIKQEGETLDFAKKIVSSLSDDVDKYSKKPETRALLAMIPASDAARRLAELDAEKYGWAKVRAQGTKEKPFYTDLTALPLSTDLLWKDRLHVEEQFHKLTAGGHLALLPLVGDEQNPEELLGITKDVASNFAVGLYAFNRDLAYCASCQKVFYGKLEKCPTCGSVNMLQSFSRM